MLAIGVMASLAEPRYINQAIACTETWIKEAEELSIPVVFFCGNKEERYFFTPDNVSFVHFSIPDDYLSATFKMWYGFRHLLNNYKADYYLMVATDNYVEVKKTLTLLKKYSSSVPSLIGGYAQARTMEREVIFPTGGGGLTLTKAALEDLSPCIEEFIKRWRERCLEYDSTLIFACDISLADAAWERGYSLIIEKAFYPCSWRGLIKKPPRENFLPVDLDILCIQHCLEGDEMFFYHNFKQHGKEYIKLENKYRSLQPSSFPYKRVYVKNNYELYLYLLIRESLYSVEEKELYLDKIEEDVVQLGEKFWIKVKKYCGEEVDYSH